MKIKGNSVIPYTQKMYKVGFGSDLWGIISEDSLDRYTYLPGAIEEHGESVKPPRMLAVPFNFGKALGKSGDREFQQTVLNATFDLLNRDQGPVLEQFDTDTGPDKPITQGTQVSNSIK